MVIKYNRQIQKNAVFIIFENIYYYIDKYFISQIVIDVNQIEIV